VEEGEKMNLRKSEELVNFSLRLPEHLYTTIVSLAKHKKYSINRTIQELLEQRVEEAKKKELWEAFTNLSQEEQDVDYGFIAQQETIEKNV
jgi:hypothetical protein